jgi:predicted nucleotidyltransferase component of viral defense system
MFEGRSIKLLSYNIETLLAEKMQTILARSIANTRLRDYYDVFMLIENVEFSWDTLSEAFTATCKKRDTHFSADQIVDELELIGQDERLASEWTRFKSKNSFVDDYDWKTMVDSIKIAYDSLLESIERREL